MKDTLFKNKNTMALILSGWVNTPKYKFCNKIFVLSILFSVFHTAFIQILMKFMTLLIVFDQVIYNQ